MEGIEERDVRCTAVDGIEVRWLLVEGIARIQSVVEQGGRVMKTYDGGDYPDLAQARDLWPRWPMLWDAVSDEL